MRFKKFHLGLALLGLALVGCVQPVTSTDEDVVLDETTFSLTALALTLLTDDATQSVEGLETAFPVLIEMDEHSCDQPDVDDRTLCYVVRSWYDPLDSDIWVVNAVSLYASSQDAVFGVDYLSGDVNSAYVEPLSDASPVGDHSVVYYSDLPEGEEYPEMESSAPNVTYRFAVGPLGVKIRVFAEGDLATLPVDSMKSELERMAYELALFQAERLEAILSDEWFSSSTLVDTTVLLPSSSTLHLPDSLTGTTLLGTSSFTQREWLGVMGIYDQDIPGFQSGALRRFSMDARPDEVVEVYILEFGTVDAARAFQLEFVQMEGVTAVSLGDEFEPLADALFIDEYYYELQMAHGRYVIDLSIYDPYKPIAVDDLQAAESDLKAFLPEVLAQW